jgi:SnoaL-like domain
MPSRKTVEAFAALVEAGDYVGAIEQFYASDASTRENSSEPVVGRDTLMAKERGVMAAFRKIEASRLGPSLIDGDTVAARWKFTFTGADGSHRVLEEIAWQPWRGEQLVEERFFYDPKQMAG